jgi:hypothetical protein
MAEVLRPLGNTLARMPAGPEHPGLTAGPVFEMFYEFGNFIPWRQAAWTLLAERAALLATCARRTAGLPGVPGTLPAVATAAAEVAAGLADHI